jgi:hypothetical protein
MIRFNSQTHSKEREREREREIGFVVVVIFPQQLQEERDVVRVISIVLLLLFVPLCTGDSFLFGSVAPVCVS